MYRLKYLQYVRQNTAVRTIRQIIGQISRYPKLITGNETRRLEQPLSEHEHKNN